MTTEATVHVVDDDEAIRDSLAILLGAAGFSVATYPSAEAFLITAPQGPGCLVIDVRMPGMGGLELQEELIRRGRRIPVIVVTAKELTPAERARLSGQIESLLQKGEFMDDNLLDDIVQALT